MAPFTPPPPYLDKHGPEPPAGESQRQPQQAADVIPIDGRSPTPALVQQRLAREDLLVQTHLIIRGAPRSS